VSGAGAMTTTTTTTNNNNFTTATIASSSATTVRAGGTSTSTTATTTATTTTTTPTAIMTTTSQLEDFASASSPMLLYAHLQGRNSPTRLGADLHLHVMLPWRQFTRLYFQTATSDTSRGLDGTDLFFVRTSADRKRAECLLGGPQSGPGYKFKRMSYVASDAGNTRRLLESTDTEKLQHFKASLSSDWADSAGEVAEKQAILVFHPSFPCIGLAFAAGTTTSTAATTSSASTSQTSTTTTPTTTTTIPYIGRNADLVETTLKTLIALYRAAKKAIGSIPHTSLPVSHSGNVIDLCGMAIACRLGDTWVETDAHTRMNTDIWDNAVFRASAAGKATIMSNSNSSSSGSGSGSGGGSGGGSGTDHQYDEKQKIHVVGFLEMDPWGYVAFLRGMTQTKQAVRPGGLVEISLLPPPPPEASASTSALITPESFLDAYEAGAKPGVQPGFESVGV
jgi:hypothetical protein